MRITALHYVPKPGGGVASPGEALRVDMFTPTQIGRLSRLGAIRIECGDPDEETIAPEEVYTAPEGAAEEVETVETVEEAPMEIDVMDGIVQDKPKKTSRRKKA